MSTLTTKRLILRDFVGTDWTAVHEIFSDPNVARFSLGMDRAYSQRWVTGKLKNQYRNPQKKSRQVLGQAIVLQEQDKLIGWIGIAPPATIGRPWTPEPGELEFAYALHRSFWGQGYMTEAVRKMMHFAFETLQVHRLIATCEVPNAASARVLEKAGMVHIETFLQIEGDFIEVPYHRYELDRTRYETEVGNGLFLD